MRLQSLRTRTLLVVPIRLVLGVGWLVAARIAGAEPGPAYGAFGIGAVAVAFVALNDPRARFLRGHPQPLPEGDARLDPLWRQAVSAAFPSTIGLTILAAIALGPQPVLAALLGGASAGLGVAAAATAASVDPALLLDRRSRLVYRR